MDDFYTYLLSIPNSGNSKMVFAKTEQRLLEPSQPTGILFFVDTGAIHRRKIPRIFPAVRIYTGNPDHINSHSQMWSMWKHWHQRVPESKWNEAETPINY